jgi:hypothetical protein
VDAPASIGQRCRTIREVRIGRVAPEASLCDSTVAAGGLIWSRRFERDRFGPSPVYGVLDAAPKGLAVCGDGLCLLGKLDSRVRFDQDLVAQGQDEAYLVKLSTEGVPIWSRRLGGQSLTDHFVAGSLAADESGNLVVAGTCVGQLVLPTQDGGERLLDCSGDQPKVLVIRFDASGRSVWSREPGTSAVIPAGIRVAVDGSGRTVVAAHVGGPLGNPTAAPEQAVVIAWDADGSELFRHSFEGGVTYPTDLALDADGSIVLVGFFAGPVRSTGRDRTDGGGVALDTAGSSTCAMKLNASGDLAWSRCFGGTSLQALDPQLALGADRSVVLAGTFMNQVDFAAVGHDAGASPSRLSSMGESDIYLAKLGPQGDFVWQRQFGNADSQTASLGLATTPEGGILFAATTRGPIALGGLQVDAGASDSPFVAQLDAEGRPSFVTQLGKSVSTSGSDGLVTGVCRSFFLVADYSGDLVAPNAPRAGATIGLVMIAGRY